MGLTEKYPSLLEDFQTGTASMARKRHRASSARGLLWFLSYTHQQDQFRPIRLIRGRKRSLSSGVLPSRQRLGGLSISEGVAPGYSK